jgi:hypothetical protein
MDNTAINLEPEVESKALAIPEQAKMITVTDNESMERANAFKLDIKEMLKSIDEFFKPMADKAFQAHRAITGKWNETKAPLKEADDHVTNQVKGYLRKVREEEERQAAILREQARQEEEERRLAQAAELEQEGNIDEANAILEEPIVYVAPVPVIETPKVDNRMYRTQVKVKVTNRLTFLKSVRPETLMECLNEAAWSAIESGLSRKAKSLGRAFDIKGCELYEV